MANYADFEAEMALDDERFDWTDEQWDEFVFEQQIAAEVAVERHAERALSIGYAT